MNEYIEQLTNLLLEKNKALTYTQARTWIELLWEDFETSSAKARARYMGSEMAVKIVTQWIMRYGSELHDFVATNPKYAHLLNSDDTLKH
ncbi:YfhJ family protein [Bacillus sp. DJP31]|uniref:YfhJ family protein n=1 Tax=Bacillus sp. DJP31 TaxID=3409789 RepID=UPI003BB68A5A